MIYALAILMKFLRYEVSLMIILRCFQDNLLGLGSNESLHLAIKLLSSSFKKGIHFMIGLFGNSSNKPRLIQQFCTELKDKWRTCHRSSSSRQGQPLCWIASMAGSLHFLTQFMSSQRLWFLATISWILVLKNSCLVFLTMLLKFFQSSTHFETQYLTSLLLHSLFHYDLECFVILMIFEFLNQILSILSVNLFIIYLRTSLLVM